ncbi:hypothetical protein, partial [uncultured Prevotella sp.]|uniref:hypothetical protein n=1 Tax=uncultured Prevotella sp. TaxID=159272 RepID=UPI0026032517
MGKDITDPLYLPLKWGGLVCPPLESPRNVLLKYCKTLSINLFRKHANYFSLFREGTEKVPVFEKSGFIQLSISG